MSIKLLLSIDNNQSLTDQQLDQNWTTIELAVNNTFALITETQHHVEKTESDILELQKNVDKIIPLDPNTTMFYTKLVLREQQKRALTNEEVDSNFLYLDSKSSRLRTDLDKINNVTIPALQDDYNAKIDTKQDHNTILDSLVSLESPGVLSFKDGVLTPRTILGSDYITITNGSGTDNPTIEVTNEVVITNIPQILTSKTIDGTFNVIRNISLTDSMRDVLPVESGGTGVTSVPDIRKTINVLVKPDGNGLVIKTDTDQSVTRSILVKGIGLDIQNPTGNSGNITIISNATSINKNNAIVSRDANGNFSATTITAELIGNVVGTAAKVTNGIYTTERYDDPDWIVSLSGDKINHVPNSALDSATITINGVDVSLGGSINFDTGTSSNLPNSIVKRDLAGNFEANQITASRFNGLVSNADVANLANTATKLTLPKNINNVPFDGTEDIVITDGTKLPLTGGSLLGHVKLPNALIEHPLNIVPKKYVDQNDFEIQYGTVTLSAVGPFGENQYADIFPPQGRTMQHLRGFLPAVGYSQFVAPSYSSNLIVIIDISLSMYRHGVWDGNSFETMYEAAGKAGQNLINHYAQLGSINVCVVRTKNWKPFDYKWFDSQNDAFIALSNVMNWQGIEGSVLDAYKFRPKTDNVAQTAFHYFSDGMDNYGVIDAFGGSLSIWRNFLNLIPGVAFTVCLSALGELRNMAKLAWDGIVKKELEPMRALTAYDLPKIAFPGIYNNSSIRYDIMPNNIRIALDNGLKISVVPVNWLAIWAKV